MKENNLKNQKSPKMKIVWQMILNNFCFFALVIIPYQNKYKDTQFYQYSAHDFSIISA